MYYRTLTRYGGMRGGWLVLLCCVLLIACTNPAAPPPDQQAITFTRAVDLSHIITQDMPHPPAAPATVIQRNASGMVKALAIGVQSGTTLRLTPIPGNAPRTVDMLSPRDLLRPAVVLDLRDRAQDNPSYRLSAEHIRDWETQHGPIPADSIVLLATGWDLRWGSPPSICGLGIAGRALCPVSPMMPLPCSVSARSLASALTRLP
ncbi:MAG: cyclase family protein [Chloroflexaceae bacterium]|nr:cyclase family protein [Chloroflexaceae bacterium]